MLWLRWKRYGRVYWGPYFNPGFLLEDACSESDEDAREVSAAECSRKVEFMAKAWEVFRAGVVNIDMGPFRRMMGGCLIGR
ncbi:hypothetical protein SUGI_1157620 [Cryptomeria japonica]|nr:hypothetical protein SUGI_1157620 [Cryptomeria japonica]